MSDNNTQLMPIETPIPDPANTRTGHDIAGIANSLRTFGQVTPIVLDAEGVVRKGNGTLMAAKSLGWTEILVRQTDLHGAKAAAYSIADNRLATKSAWDDDALAKTLAALQNDESIDELCTGFDAAEIEKLIGGAAGPVAPGDFNEVDENIETAHACPKCGYRWSGGE